MTIDSRSPARERSRQVVGFLFLGSGSEQETVYRQQVGFGDRAPNPDAWQSVELTADGKAVAEGVTTDTLIKTVR